MKACQHCLGAGQIAVEREYGPGNRRIRNADVEWIDVDCDVCEGAGVVASVVEYALGVPPQAAAAEMLGELL